MTRIFSIFCIGALAVCFVPASASACRTWLFEFRILFKEIPFGLDAPIIANVTITSTQDNGRYHFINLARVDKVLKGQIEGETIRFSFHQTSCGPGTLKPGQTGVILGSIERNEMA